LEWDMKKVGCDIIKKWGGTKSLEWDMKKVGCDIIKKWGGTKSWV
jgi:hypothetical protein